MNVDDLKAAGFREHSPSSHDRYDLLLQKKITDEYGVRYFIDCMLWKHSKHGTGLQDGWEIQVNYNDGCALCPSKCAIRITAWAGVDQWTSSDIINWAAELWERLAPNYYEREL